MPRCAHCALPLFGEAIRGAPTAGGRSPLYCCAGCRMLGETLGPDGHTPTETERRLLYRFFAGALATGFTMVLSLAVASGYGFGALRALTPSTADPAHAALLLAAIPALALLAPPVLRGGLTDLRRGQLSLEVLFSLGVVAGTAASLYSLARGAGPVYLETVAMLLTLYTLGRYLESRAKGRAARVLGALLETETTQYERLEPDPGRVGAADLRPGDRVRLRAGDPVPADGTVVHGRAFVDASTLTGESDPAPCAPGTALWAGTVVLDGPLDLEVDAVGPARRLARLEEEARRALATPPRLASMTGRALRVLVPLAVALAVATFAGWLAAGAGFDRALYASLAVVLIACPCALGLAVPLALVTALGAAARGGILVRDGDALLRLATVRAVVLDKTGTLTRARTARVQPLVGTAPDGTDDTLEPRLLALAAALETGVRHPLAEAVVHEAKHRGLPLPPADDVHVHPGQGVTGCVHDADGLPRRVAIGRTDLMQALGVPLPPEAATTEGTWIAVDGVVEGHLEIVEQAVEEAPSTVAALRALGLHVEVVSGDRAERTRVLTEALGVPGAGISAPERKRERVQTLQATHGAVAFVGDGTNDAPALAAADVGVALPDGTTAALGSSDVVLYRERLDDLPRVLRLARRTRRVVRQNLAWTFAYNGTGLVVAAAGLLHPILAVAIMTGSSVLVTWNALRLRNALPAAP